MNALGYLGCSIYHPACRSTQSISLAWAYLHYLSSLLLDLLYLSPLPVDLLYLPFPVDLLYLPCL